MRNNSVLLGPRLLTPAVVLLLVCGGRCSAQERRAEGEDDLLATFCAELIPIRPGETEFDELVWCQETASQTIGFSHPRLVIIRHQFSISKYEVPQDLWEQVMGENPSRWKGPRNSVEMISFDESITFCERLTEMLRERELIEMDELVRLPTEAEWEYCCRAGTTARYSFGDDVAELDRYAWHTGNAAGNDPPVGALEANPWGLFDIHGYLWEWCISDTTAPDAFVDGNAADWAKLNDGPSAVIRGGSWKDAAELLTSGYRRSISRATRDDAIGFRCVVCKSDRASIVQANGFRAGFDPSAQDEIVGANASLELLWEHGEFTEGPVARKDGVILFSDIGNRILAFDPNSGQVDLFREPSGRANGLAIDSQGRLLACEGANTGGGRRISITADDGNVTTLADRFEGRRFNSPNDLVLDGERGIYFSDPRYVGDERRELEMEAVFRVSFDGQVTLATSELSKPNGLLMSLDGRKAFVAEHDPQGAKRLIAFDVGEDGKWHSPRSLFDFGDKRGIDGMTMDAAGNLYATAGSGDDAGIYVFAPDGRRLASIPLPGSPTNCCFGGPEDRNRLYITAQNPPDSDHPEKYGLYRISLLSSGRN